MRNAASRLTLYTRQQANLAIATWYAAYSRRTTDPDRALDDQDIIGALEWIHSAGPGIVEDADRDNLAADLCSGMGQFWRDHGRTSASLRYQPRWATPHSATNITESVSQWASAE